MNTNDLACNYTKEEILAAYVAAEKPYEVCAHTTMGGYMEFATLERGIISEEVAREVCDNYAGLWHKSDNIKSVCVRKHGTIVYEVEL